MRFLRLPKPPAPAQSDRQSHPKLLPAFVFSARYQRGYDAFAAYLSERAAHTPPGWSGAAWFILCIGEECANIRLQDVWRPWRFLVQAAAAPPFCFGPNGFAPHLVDDRLPARHYSAFVFVGFWLPPPLAWLTLYVWEIAGFLRYGFHWSAPDLRLGLIGIRHGALIGRYGPTILPALVAADLTASESDVVPND